MGARGMNAERAQRYEAWVQRVKEHEGVRYECKTCV